MRTPNKPLFKAYEIVAIVAFVLFLVLKAMLTLKARFEKEKAAEAPPPPSPSEVYLKEIRDALVKK